MKCFRVCVQFHNDDTGGIGTAPYIPHGEYPKYPDGVIASEDGTLSAGQVCILKHWAREAMQTVASVNDRTFFVLSAYVEIFHKKI